MPPSDADEARRQAARVFDQRMDQPDKIRASASKRFGRQPVSVTSERIGSTGKPYIFRQLGVVDDSGNVIAVARCNRAGAVYWHEPRADERYEVETRPA